MAVTGQNHRMWSGETKVFTVTVTGCSTLVGATITWLVKDPNGTTTLTKTVGSGITISSATVFTITLATGDTSSLSGMYPHEARGTLADSSVVTFFTGTLFIEDTITS